MRCLIQSVTLKGPIHPANRGRFDLWMSSNQGAEWWNRRSHVAFIHTWPLSSTMTLLQLITVLRRCAMMRVVHLPKAERMVSWMRRSVSVSMAAVASSNIRIFKKQINNNLYSKDASYNDHYFYTVWCSRQTKTCEAGTVSAARWQYYPVVCKM